MQSLKAYDRAQIEQYSKLYPKIEHVEFDGSRLKPGDLLLLSTFQNMKSVIIYNATQVTEACIRAVTLPPQLQQIEIYGSACTDSSSGYSLAAEKTQKVAFHWLVKHPYLETVVFDDLVMSMPKPTSQEFSEQLKGTHLASVGVIDYDFGCHHLCDRDMKLLVKKLPRLRSITLSGCKNITQKGVDYLASLPQLERLELYGNSYEPLIIWEKSEL